MKGNTSPGSGQIPAELIQAGGETLLYVMYKLINSIRSENELPELWKESIIVLVFKVIKLAVVIIGAFHFYEFHTQFHPISFHQS
jgi:uncharacterized membrane-anchored protein